MCGIAGGFGDLSSSTLRKMVTLLGHRGPDYSDDISIGDVHLAHSRLSIIDLSEASNQPLWDAEKKACIVFNGEIYNYQTLRDELEVLGYLFHSDGDAEVLVNLYLEYGENLFDRVNGIYAFAIWDVKNAQLLIARDPFGVKPIYYHQNDTGFYFASEIKSLLQVESLERVISYDTLLRSLVFLWSPGEFTLLEGVKKIKPGHFLIIKNKRIILDQCFWSWPDYNPEKQSSSKAIELISEAIAQSVKEQMIADVPVGAFLSGGVDSSLLVALAKPMARESMECFTIDLGESDGEFIDDLPYAKKVSQYLSVPLNILNITPDIASLLPKMVYHLDELQADPAAINVLLISEFARQKGIKVLISGAGGDDIFTGYRRHYALSMECYWSWLPKSFRVRLKRISGALPKGSVLGRRLSKAFKYADLDSSERLISYFYWIDPEIVRDLFEDNIKRSLDKTPMAFLQKDLDSQQIESPLERMLYLERRYFLVDHNFNYTDKMSMCAGVEVRVPFLDKRVAMAASKIKTNLKQKGSHGKWILKKVAEKLLPKEVIYRPKTGFGAPIRKWIASDLVAVVDDLLSEKRISQRGIFKYSEVRKIIDDNSAGKEDYSYTIFALMCFEIWCQKFIDDI